jgi:predicted metal-binding protein
MALHREGAMGDVALLSEWHERLGAMRIDVRSVGVDELVFDERTVLKCRYSCPAWGRRWTCAPEAWGPHELIPLLRKYRTVLVLSGADGPGLNREALALERAAFAAGYPLALAVAVTPCSSCETCTYPLGECRRKPNLRPESAMSGLDTLGTMDSLGIPRQTSEGAWTRVSYLFLE